MKPEDAEGLIMRARIAAGWVTEEDLRKEEPQPEEAGADAGAQA
jgi:N utilization substance protein A